MEDRAMPSKKTTARLGAKTAVVMYRHPRLRRATVRTARPVAKVGWRVGKIVAKRKARRQLAAVNARAEVIGAQVLAMGDGLAQLADVARVGGQLVIVYGPLVAEVLGLVEPPKRSSRGPVLMAGIVFGAAAVYFLEPEHGAEHRQRAQELVTHQSLSS